MMQKTGKSKKRIVRKIIWIIVILLILAGAGYYGYTALRQEYKVTYNSYTASVGSISNALSFSGNLSLIDSAVYTAPSSGTVRTVYVAAGDKVKDGDKLMRLSNGSVIEAEFDGSVNAVNFAEGDTVYAGDSLVQVADFEHLKISMRVDEYDIGDVSVGQKCTATVTANEKKYETEIAKIDHISSSQGNVAYYSATAYVDVEEGTWPGMQVTVSVPQEEATNVVILKADALSFDAENQAYVWMKDEADELKQVFVKTGVSNGNYVEITEGLSEGDEVFVEAKEEQSSALGGLFAGLFGSQQFNGGGNMPSGMPGNMPSGFPGGFSGDFSGGFSGGGSGSMRPSGSGSGMSGSNRASGSSSGNNGGGGNR